MGALSKALRPREGKQLIPVASWSGFPTVTADTSAGVAVSQDSALRVSAVFACVRVLAETVASLPLLIYDRLPQGGKRRTSEHPLYRVLHDRPNPLMSSFVWRETMMGHVVLWGNAYSEIVRNRDGSVELWPLRPDRMSVYLTDERERVYEYTDAAGRPTVLSQDQIFHLPGLSFDGLVGYSVLKTAAREHVGLALAAQEYGGRYFANDTRPGIVLTHPGTISEAAAGRLKAAMDAYKGSANGPGRTSVLEEGITVHEIGAPPKDAQFVETRKFTVNEIARVFRVPPHMIGDLERATFSNIEQQGIDFVTHTIRPWLVRWEQELHAQLMDLDSDSFPEFLVEGLLRGETLTRYQAYQIGLTSGFLTKEEVRERENLNPQPELGQLTPAANIFGAQDDTVPVEAAPPTGIGLNGVKP